MLFPTVRLPAARASKLQKASPWQRVFICWTRGSAGSSAGTKTGTKEGLCFGPKKKWRSKYSVSYVNKDVPFRMAPAGGTESLGEAGRTMLFTWNLWNRCRLPLPPPYYFHAVIKGRGGLSLQLEATQNASIVQLANSHACSSCCKGTLPC